MTEQHTSDIADFTYGDVNPTSVTDAYWVWCDSPDMKPKEETYGKWLVLKKVADLDKSWHMIRRAVEAGEFGDGCRGAKCSTGCKNLDSPSNTSRGVFLVYTTRESMDKVGLILIHKVKHTIKYKTNEATGSGLYAHKCHKKVTCRTIYWNGGYPSFGN